MGFLTYAGSSEYEFDDRTLAHMKIAVVAKLRRRESFLMSWAYPPEKGSGRVSLWMSPEIPLVFRFSGSRQPELDREWVAGLERMANTPGGLVLETPRKSV
ncbi:MAG: DUF7882 family protein [Galactobacter sp.]